MSCTIIPDGYEDSTDEHGLGALFRPLPYGDYQAMVNSLTGLTPEKAVEVEAEHFASRVKSWDVKDPDGNALPVSGENFRALPTPAGQHLKLAILGQLGGNQQEDDEKN